MRIFVCVKHVPDTEAKITIKDGNKIDESVSYVLNPYDEFAVEEAVALKGKENGELVLVALGKADAMETLRLGLAMGADRGVLVKTDDPVDHITVGKALAKVIEQEGGADIVFMGKHSVDSEGMQTQYRLGANLNMPVATNVIAFEKNGDLAVVESEIEGGARLVLEMKLPCVVATTKGLNEPRYPSLPAIMKAKKKEVKEIDLSSLGLEAPKGKMEITELKLPPEKPEGKVLEGDDPKPLVEDLVKLLQEEAKVL